LGEAQEQVAELESALGEAQGRGAALQRELGGALAAKGEAQRLRIHPSGPPLAPLTTSFCVLPGFSFLLPSPTTTFAVLPELGPHWSPFSPALPCTSWVQALLIVQGGVGWGCDECREAEAVWDVRVSSASTAINAGRCGVGLGLRVLCVQGGGGGARADG